MSGIRITDGTATIVLNDGATGAYQQVEYVPATPEFEETEITSPSDDGGELIAAPRRNPTESARVYFDGGTASVRSTFNSINQLFEQARRRQTRRNGGGPRVYLEMRPNDTDPWWRAELLDGRAMLEDEKPWRKLQAGWQVLTLAWKRRYYFEGPESYLSLSNLHGSGTGGVTVYNTNDSGKKHYVDIAAGAVGGDLPAPYRLELTNSYNDANPIGNVYTGLSAVVNPAAAYLVFEGESATSLQTSSVVSNASYSNGQARQWNSSGAGEANLAKWSLSSAQLAALNGGFYRLLVGGSFTGTMSVQFKVLIPGSSAALYATPWVWLTSAGLQDIASIPLPPYLTEDASSTYGLELWLVVRGESVASWTFVLDVLHLLPTESWRVLRERGFGTGYTGILADNQAIGAAYIEWSGQRLGNYVVYGQPGFLVPAIAQRLYLLHATLLGAYLPGRTMSARLAYRPRRLLI